MVWQLDDELWFPDPHWGEESGLVAVGGDLSAARLLLAYSNGYFPWYSFHDFGEPHWYCPLNRYVIFPNEIHVSHSMKQLLRQQHYEVTINQDFYGVIFGCSTAQGRNKEDGAWLGSDIIEAYTKLHNLGFAASVEVWEHEPLSICNVEKDSNAEKYSDAIIKDNKAVGKDSKVENISESVKMGRRLVGGLYGVTLCNAFFGESMFSLVPNASKLALIHLALTMQNIGGRFIDCQFETPHFASMGGRYITYEQYMKILRNN